jgi:predicted branched-subunit amino acid permease
MSSTPRSSHKEIIEIDKLHWFLKGARGIASVPALILMSSFVGFAGFAREAGFSLGETIFMVGTIWALPSHLVLVGGVIAGASTSTIIISVTLASVRLMPMVMAQVPLLKTKHTSRWTLLFLSHFIAVTSWVFLQERYMGVPKAARAAFFAGFAITLSTICTILVGITYTLAGTFPPILAAALFFLTPVYFLTSLWRAAWLLSDKWAMVLGLVLGPVFHLIAPDVDILLAGGFGGVAAFAIHRMQKHRSEQR